MVCEMKRLANQLLASVAVTAALALLGGGVTMKSPARADDERPPQSALKSANASCQAASTGAPSPSAAADASDPGTMRRGDHIRLAFYELLEVQEDKWGAARQREQQPARGVQLRPEFSNEYLVGEDGSISIPILGTFAAAHLTHTEFQQRVECAFTSFLGRKGFVNVLGVTRQPIYVVGRVKTSGSFDFAEGLTVLHAVALAGGFDKAQVEPWQISEMTRETEKIQLALDQATRKIAQVAAIEAANTGRAPEIPAELSALVGTSRASALVSSEFEPRKLEVRALVHDAAGLDATVDSASSELEIRKARMPLLGSAIELRQDRVRSLKALASTGTISSPVVIQAQSELLDVEDRRQETLTAINAAEGRLTNARQQLETLRNQATISFKNNLLQASNAASDAIVEGESAAGVLKSMAISRLALSAQDPEFRIIRRSNGKAVSIAASGMTLLEPGDLVEVTNRPVANSPFQQPSASGNQLETVSTPNLAK